MQREARIGVNQGFVKDGIWQAGVRIILDWRVRICNW